MRRRRDEREAGPLTLGQTLSARVRLIVWCKACQHQADAPRMFTVAGPSPDYDAEGFLWAQGYDVGPRDIVVQILRFVDCAGLELIAAK